MNLLDSLKKSSFDSPRNFLVPSYTSPSDLQTFQENSSDELWNLSKPDEKNPERLSREPAGNLQRSPGRIFKYPPEDTLRDYIRISSHTSSGQANRLSRELLTGSSESPLGYEPRPSPPTLLRLLDDHVCRISPKKSHNHAQLPRYPTSFRQIKAFF